MHSFKILICVCLVSVFLLFRPAGTEARDCFDRVVAIVNNDIITLYELNTEFKQIAGVDPSELQKTDDQQYFRARWKVLDMLIDERIAAEKAKELDIRVTPDDVDNAIERIKKQNDLTQEDLMAHLKSRGLTYERYRENVKKELQRVRLINYEVKSKIIIRDEKIKEYYEAHKKDFSSPGEVHLATIFLKKEESEPTGEEGKELQKAKEILSKLKQGADFGSLAKEYSEGPGAQDGGDLGFFRTSQLDTVLSKTVNSLPVGGVSEPIIRDGGVQIIKVLEKREAGLRPLSQVKEQIYDTLYKGEVNKRFVSWIKELRDKSYIKVLF
jgi:peptidyl-prolyl cis-trans isomerase SurA